MNNKIKILMIKNMIKNNLKQLFFNIYVAFNSNIAFSS